MEHNNILFIFIILILLSKYFENTFIYNTYYFNLDKDSKDKDVLFKKYNEYLNICRNQTLIKNIYYNNLVSPKITAIIPVYNAEKTLKTAVRSIQNQNMNEIEIILVDDNSTDNSINIINELMIEDKRIKLIKNKKNHGTLYSRSIGAMNAKGKYIMALDNDDLFLYGIFEKCYEEAENNNLDIIEFSGIQICKNCSIDDKNIFVPYFLQFKNDGMLVSQPELSTFDYIRTNTSFDFIDVFVWGKAIKTEIYLKTLDKIGNYIKEHNICLTEDKIFTFGLFKVANSFKYINIFGIVYIENIDSICHSWPIKKQKRIIHDFFMLSVIFYKLSKNTDEVQIVVDEFKKHYKEYSLFLDNEHKILLENLKQSLLNNTHILEKEKKLIS